MGKPAEPGGGALPPPRHRTLFEHVFDTAKDNPAGCRLVKFGSQVGGKPMPEHGLMDTVQFADAHGFAAASADTGGQR